LKVKGAQAVFDFRATVKAPEVHYTSFILLMQFQNQARNRSIHVFRFPAFRILLLPDYS
jgi:hypothetical protein